MPKALVPSADEVMSSLVSEQPIRDADMDWSQQLEHRIDELCLILATYLQAKQIEAIRDACYFSARAHAGQKRKSGEPYVFHPIAVAKILAEVRFDHETIIGAILHDVIEDTPFDKAQLSERFGAEVAKLVDGVSKLTQITFSSKQEAQAENFRKMFLAMAKDLRVIMIKLADRLHNMRTLGVMKAQKRRRIARETLEIYAPIASRLGMNRLCNDLENLGFDNLYPARYRILSEALHKRQNQRKELIQKLETRIQAHLREEGVRARLTGQTRSPWSIYNRMRHKHLSFKDVYDIYVLRIIVDKADTCYRVLGLVHGLYKPIMGRFKDYIAIPKANGYQSLHTVLFIAHEMPLEVQICTREMHIMAETGVASHWLYRSPDDQGDKAHRRAREWLQKLLDIQRRAGNSVEFLENVKVDMFPDEVYVFTPRGKIIELPRGATAVDFAYAIHSDVGNTCMGAKIDRRLMPLRTPLANGQTVEVIISPTARPNPTWLNFVVTGKARSSIRHYLKNLQREEAILLGKRLLEKALLGRVSGFAELPRARIDNLISEFKATSFDDILADIGLGKRLAPLLAKRLLAEDDENTAPSWHSNDHSRPLLIKGTEGAVVSFGRCCRPLPGDPIMGYLSTGRGIVIHRDTCKHIADYRKNPQKWLEVEWEQDIDADFSAELRLDMTNKRGVLASVAAAISEADSNIENINTPERDGVHTLMNITLNVRNSTHLDQIMRRLRQLPAVLSATRPN